MPKLLNAIIIVTLGAIFSTPITADEARSSEQPKDLVNQRFSLVDRAGKQVGTYYLKATELDTERRIEITEHLSLTKRGDTIAFRSKILYAMKPTITPISASTVTSIGKKTIMTGKIAFSEKSYDYTANVDHPTDTKEETRKIQQQAVARPDGLIIFTAAVPVLAPRILATSDGEKSVVSVEFPDDIGTLVNVKANWRLRQDPPAADGSFTVGLYRGEEERATSSYRYAKEGKLRSMLLFGKFECVPVE